MEYQPIIENIVDIFLAKGVEIRGTIDEPLFTVPNIAKIIDDVDNYKRVIANYDDDEVIKPNRTKNITRLTFTESGLYRYLMQSKKPKARPFQKWVTKTLVELRKKTVSDALVAAKIANDELAVEKFRSQTLIAAVENLVVSTYDDKRADSDPQGLAEFYIAKYIAGEFSSGKNSSFNRDNLPNDVIFEIYTSAHQYFEKDQAEFSETVYEILDKYKQKMQK